MKKKYQDRKKVLFLCAGNSARSIMAQGILEYLYGDAYKVYSACSAPVIKLDPFVIRVLEVHGISTARLRGKSWNEYIGKDFDVIVTLGDRIKKETCPVFPAQFLKLHWDISEPGRGKKTSLAVLEDFFITYRIIHRMIRVHF